MIKRLSLLLGLLLLASPVWATTQTIISGDDTDVSSTSARQITFVGAYNSTWAARTATSRSSVIPAAGTLSLLRVRLNAAPGAGNSVVIVAYLDGSATAMTCTVTHPATTCQDGANSFSITAGQNLLFDIDYSAGATTAPMQWTAVFTPTTADKTILSGGGGGNVLAETNWIPVQGIAVGGAANEGSGTSLVSAAGTVRDLYCETTTAPGVGNSFIYTVRLTTGGSTSNTALTCTISGAALTANDTSNSFSVAAGDGLSVDLTYGGTPTDRQQRQGMVFIPTTTGQSLAMAARSNTNVSNSADNFFALNGAGAPTATEAGAQQLSQSGPTVAAIYAESSVAPGSGKSYAITLREDSGGGFADTACTCTISGSSATTCNAVCSVAVGSDYLYTTEVSPASTPTATTVKTAYLLSTAAAAARRVIVIQ